MKVGTDGVLLGAWADVANAHRLLDIGCGSGLIALMAAQRSPADITAVDIDPLSVTQAMENCRNSPFANRISVIETDVREFRPQELFDCILTNPPYYEETLISPDSRRATARHTSEGIAFVSLIAEAKRLMLPDALLQLILPYSATGRFISQCALYNLSLLRRTDVSTQSGKPPKRSLLCFRNNITPTTPLYDTLILSGSNNSRSEQYIELTRDFYLEQKNKCQ